MSLFKCKEWWSNAKSHSVDNENKSGITCMKIDKFSSHNDSDCILLGEGTLLKIYKPNVSQDSSLLEIDLCDIVLEINTGKFVGATGDREIIILHPQCYVIYEFHVTGGLSDAGDQNHIVPIIRHFFKRRGYGLTLGPFGGSKSRDLICVQSLDATLSFFDQDTFLFMCIFNDVLIPGPVAYVASSDFFVICKSTWSLEIYSYQQLRELSELSLRQKKTNIPQWTYSAGEEISAVQVIRTSTNFSSIVALGERHLYCFQDNGLTKHIIRFDFIPICFHAYLIGWYYEPGARLLVMVASDDSKLYVYEGGTLLWACDLILKAIALSRCFLNNLPGGIVTLAPNKMVSVNYLGTEPDLNPRVNLVNELLDPEKIQAELENVEESLKEITAEEKGMSNLTDVEKFLTININVGLPVLSGYQGFAEDNVLLQLISCPLVVIITCEKHKLIKSVQITYICSSPFTISESVKYIEDFNRTESIEVNVSLTNQYDVSDTKVKILFHVIDHTGKLITFHRIVLLPLNLYCTATEVGIDNEHKLFIHVSEPCLDLENIFTDFSRDELTNDLGTTDNITLEYRTSRKNVTIRATAQEYSIEANHFSEISGILDFFLERLNEHYSHINIGAQITIIPTEEFITNLTHKFLKSVEIHSKERLKLKSLEDDLQTLQRQFTAVQKRLLIQYGSLPPGDCDHLEFLMRDTYERLTKAVQEIIQNREGVCRVGNTLASVGRLIIHILRYTSVEAFKVILIEEMLSLDSLNDDCQQWEEAVTQIAPFVYNKLFMKSEKDKEKLAPVTEQEILSHINLKRFLKQLKSILESVLGGQDDGVKRSKDATSNVVRTEELVELI